MKDELLNQAFDSVTVPEYCEHKRQQTIHQAHQIFQQVENSCQENTSPNRPINNNQSRTSLLRQIMDKVNNHGAMVAASVMALAIGLGIYQNTSIKDITSIQQLSNGQQTVNPSISLGSGIEQMIVKPETVEDSKLNKRLAYVNAGVVQQGQAESNARQTSAYTIADDSYQQLPRGLNAPQTGNKFADVDSNPVKQVLKNPVSTFSIDTDTASYSFIRRQLQSGYLPEVDAVRVEELINYFNYNYPQSADTRIPFTTTTSVVPSPWNSQNKLIHIGIKAFEKHTDEKPKSNLVFLVDTSGSMQSQDKLPLLINSLRLLVNTLNAEDSIAIVAYAGHAGIVLEPTQVKDKHQIIAALETLAAGGSTAGHAGIKQAYALAQQHFDENAVNRIFLATDGDFNIGIDSPDQLKDYIADKRKSGVFLSVLGFGDGNYNDNLMQSLAQNGNGQAFYIDTLNEAQKVLVDEASSTLFPVAKDVKIQIEFNPALVSEYRLIGYETRQLNTEDFNNDKVDAGEIGAGHVVTAIYEITPADASQKLIDDPRYQSNQPATPVSETFNHEYGFVKLRYKTPDATQSQKITTPITTDQEFKEFDAVDSDVRFAIAVAGFGQLLKNSVYTQALTFDEVLALAQSARGADPYGYRSEFIQLVKLANALKSE